MGSPAHLPVVVAFVVAGIKVVIVECCIIIVGLGVVVDAENFLELCALFSGCLSCKLLSVLLGKH